MITSANIGMGGPTQNVKCDKLLAICDVRKDKLRGGMPGERHTDGVDRYLDFRHVLDRDDIDAVAVGERAYAPGRNPFVTRTRRTRPSSCATIRKSPRHSSVP